MAHGDKAKAKTGKAVRQASGKKASSKAVEASKAGGKKSVETGKKGSGAGEKAAAKAPAAQKDGGAKAQAVKAVTPAKGGDGRKSGADTPPGGFTNPVIANAFKRAVKKYPNAFRKLTD